MNNPLQTSPYGSRIGSGAGSIDIVVHAIPVGASFTVEEIEQKVREQALPERGAVYEHLRSLTMRGHICKSENGWQRIN